jgi:hypothetical protein
MADPVEAHLELLQTGVQLLNSHIEELEVMARQRVYPSVVEDLINSTNYVTKKQHIALFAGTCEFLYTYLRSHDRGYRYLIPNLREIIEIYATVLYLSFESPERQWQLITARNLQTIVKGVRESQQAGEMVKQYALVLKQYKEVFDYLKLEFPANPLDFSNNFVQKKKLKLPDVKVMLKNEFLKEASPQFGRVFKLDTLNPYLMYSYFSDYVHGHPLTGLDHERMKYWVIAYTTLLITLMVELIDTKILERNGGRSVRDWVKDVSQKAPPFIEAWKREISIASIARET